MSKIKEVIDSNNIEEIRYYLKYSNTSVSSKDENLFTLLDYIFDSNKLNLFISTRGLIWKNYKNDLFFIDEVKYENKLKFRDFFITNELFLDKDFISFHFDDCNQEFTDTELEVIFNHFQELNETRSNLLYTQNKKQVNSYSKILNLYEKINKIKKIKGSLTRVSFNINNEIDDCITNYIDNLLEFDNYMLLFKLCQSKFTKINLYKTVIHKFLDNKGVYDKRAVDFVFETFDIETRNLLFRYLYLNNKNYENDAKEEQLDYIIKIISGKYNKIVARKDKELLKFYASIINLSNRIAGDYIFIPFNEKDDSIIEYLLNGYHAPFKNRDTQIDYYKKQGLDKALKSLVNEVNYLNSNIKRNNSNITSINEQIDDILQRIEELENKVDSNNSTSFYDDDDYNCE